MDSSIIEGENLYSALGGRVCSETPVAVVVEKFLLRPLRILWKYVTVLCDWYSFRASVVSFDALEKDNVM